MPIPDIRRRSGSLLLALAAGHIVLISAQVNTRSGVPVLQAFVFGVFAEVQRGTAAVVGGVRRTWEEYAALKDVHADNLALQQQIRELQVAMQRERAMAAEAESLRRMLDLRDRSEVPTLAAEVIGTSPAADFRSVTIDRGSRDRVKTDMAVISPAGAVGRVVMLSPHAAKVQLLTDRNAAVAVMVGETRAQAIAMGTGESLLKLEYLSGSASIQTGDAVVTSGIDGIYPEGFVVGRVEQIDRAGGLFRSVRVRPAVDFSALEFVLVVTAPAFVGPRAPDVGEPDSAAGQRRGFVEPDSAAGQRRGFVEAGGAGARR
jgi:rod shape-determining protein MreC